MKYPYLTQCEEIVMKSIWDASRDISLVELMEVLKKNYGRDWKRSTICTFISHMTEKGYIKSYRNGRVFYYKPIIKESDYLDLYMQEVVDFWFAGDKEAAIQKINKAFAQEHLEG